MAKKKVSGPTRQVLTLEVTLIGGPMSEEFCEANPTVTRTIEFCADQTLADLHEAIFTAFDRWENHLFEFEIGKKPRDRNATIYELDEDSFEDFESGDMATRFKDLPLSKGTTLFYWFDFGDDWWHSIKVKKSREEPVGEKYPKLVGRVGQSPPQYDVEEEDYYEDEPEAPDFDEPSDEDAADAACLVAEMHLKNFEYLKAIEAFTRAIDTNPTLDAYLGRINACRALAEQDEARLSSKK